MKETERTKPTSDEYQRFKKFAKAIITERKSELAKRQAEYVKKKTAKKRRAA